MNSEEKYNRLWEKIESDKLLIKNTFSLAERDLKTSKDLFKNKNYDWAFSVSYNAMLQAGRTLMFLKGFRPKGEYKHVSVVEFVKKEFGKEFAEKILFMFNKIRKKRHQVVYEEANIVSEKEVINSLKIAEDFVEKVRKMIK